MRNSGTTARRASSPTRLRALLPATPWYSIGEAHPDRRPPRGIAQQPENDGRIPAANVRGPETRGNTTDKPGMEENMTSKERVFAAFAEQETDKVPVCHISCSSGVASALLGREAYVGFGIQQWREATALWNGADAHAEFVERSFQDILEINRILANDIYRMAYPRCRMKPTKRIDENTFLFEYGPEENWKVLRYDPSQEHIQVIYDYAPGPDSMSTFAELECAITAREKAFSRPPAPRVFSDDDFSVRAQRFLGDEVVVRMGGGGVSVPREAVWLEAVVLRPDLVARHLDLQVENARRTVGPLIEFGFTLLFGGGDFAGYDGPFYSPRSFHELMLPRLRQVVEIIHRHGGRSIFASDGDLWPVADDLFGRSGVDGFYEIDRRAGMDLDRLRDRFPELTLIGNINSHNLHMNTREEVVAETLSCLDTAKDRNGIIVGVSNMIMPGTPIENVVAMLETIEEYR